MFSIEVIFELIVLVCRMLSFNIDFFIIENIVVLFWIILKIVKFFIQVWMKELILGGMGNFFNGKKKIVEIDLLN